MLIIQNTAILISDNVFPRMVYCIIIYKNNANLSNFARTDSKLRTIFIKTERRARTKGYKKKGGAAGVAGKLRIT